MGYRVEDRRTIREKYTHIEVIVGEDPTMTEWGREAGRVGPRGRSLAAWACLPTDADKVLAWVQARGDLKRVRRDDGGRLAIHGLTAWRLGDGDHLSIYVVREGHPSLEGGAA
jgi:hypothetical protein